MLTLDVAVATYKPEGIKNVEKMICSLPVQERVRYVVSWQQHEDTPVPPALTQRGDVVVYRLDSLGLSNNRNNLIEHCRGDVVLIADDDLEYYPDFAHKILKSFEENDTLDVGLFKVDFTPAKTYPPEDCKISLPFPKKYYVASVEIAFRRESIGDLRFYPEMGLGAPKLQAGEEELFVVSAIRRGLNVRFINETIAVHSEISTGLKVSPGILRGQGFMISVVYPVSFIARNFLKAWRIKRQQKGGLIKSFYHLCQGGFCAKWKMAGLPKDYRW